MLNVSNFDDSLPVVNPQIERDVNNAVMALTTETFGSLIAATVFHAPPEVISTLKALPKKRERYRHHETLNFGVNVEGARSLLRRFPKKDYLVPMLQILGSVTATLTGTTWFVTLCMGYEIYDHWLGILASIGTGFTVSGLVAARLFVWNDPLRLKRAQQRSLITLVQDGGWREDTADITNFRDASLCSVGMVLLAQKTLLDIRSSSAWNNPVMETHVARFDLDRELAGITSAALTLWRMRHDIKTTKTDDNSGTLAGAANQWRERHDLLRHSIMQRLTLLKEYRDHLTSLEKLIASQVTVRKTQERFAEIDSSLVQVALGSAAITELETVSLELADMEAGLVAQNKFLDTPLH